MNRRGFLSSGAAFLLALGGSGLCAPSALWVEDVHTGLQRVRVHQIARPRSTAEVQSALSRASLAGLDVCVAGARHASGGQAFAEDACLLDMTAMSGILQLDSQVGQVEVQAGIQWPGLIAALRRMAGGRWTIRQKQAIGRLTIGGSVSANAHGNGLRMPPLVGDLVAFDLVDADGVVRRCSRTENSDLFSLACGGYGLFGVITTARLQLVARKKLRALVDFVEVDGLLSAVRKRQAEGALYGSIQLNTDEGSADFLRQGVFPYYVEDADDAYVREDAFGSDDGGWLQLMYLAHTHRRQAFTASCAAYLSAAGQSFWADDILLSESYIDHYHAWLDRKLGESGSEVIAEFFVPLDALPRFMEALRRDCLHHPAGLILCSVRLAEPETTTCLAWSREAVACVSVNLHTVRTAAGVLRSQAALRRYLDIAIGCGGRYYLTFGRFATSRQLLACYPQFSRFLEAKQTFDPRGLFQSEWYRHYRRTLS